MVSERARQKIGEARQTEANLDPLYIRKYILPLKSEINQRARNIMDVINWREYERHSQVLPPPLLRPYTDEELETLNLNDFPRYLCHSQHNERFVHEATIAAKYNIGTTNQKISIICTMKSREDIPTNANKNDFN